MKRMWISRVLFSLFLLSLLVPSCARRPSVTLAGSTAFQPFAEQLAEDFMDTRSQANITVQGGGSAVGLNSALTGTAQIGMADLVSLPPEAAELTATVVARDGIAIVVHPSNPLSNITMEQARALFNGTITNWKEIGGLDHSVTVVSREAGSGTRSSFEKILGGIKLTKEAMIQDSNGTIRETVANDANSLGYLSHGLVNEKVKALSIGGVVASEENIIAGSYALVRPVYFLTKGALPQAAQEFLDYVLSEEGQATIKKNGLLPAR